MKTVKELDEEISKIQEDLNLPNINYEMEVCLSDMLKQTKLKRAEARIKEFYPICPFCGKHLPEEHTCSALKNQ